MKCLSLLLLLLFIAIPASAGPAIIVDETSSDCQLVGKWADNKRNNPEGKGFSDGGCVGGTYHYTSSHNPYKRTGREKAIYTPNLPKAGTYKVEVSWRGTGNRSSKVTYEVKYAGGSKRFTFSQRTDGATWKTLGKFPFTQGKSGSVAMVSDGGSSASVDAARFTFVDGGTGIPATPGDGGTMDDVLGTTGTDGTSGSSVRLAGKAGRKNISFSKAEKVTIRCFLSTWGSARLGAELNGNNLLSWERSSDTDPSPLQVQGKSDAKSMYEPKPGDWSPRERSHSFDVPAGGKLTIYLEGDWGDADPFIEVQGATGNVSDGGSTGGNPTPGDSDPDTGNTGSGSADVNIDFSRDWNLEVDSEVTSTKGFARIFCGDGSVHNRKIDLFTCEGFGLRFRLANKAIQFTTATAGKIHNLNESHDHWLDTTVGRIEKGKSYKFRLEYKAFGSFRLLMNGDLIGAGTFKIIKNPGNLTKIVFPAARGTARMM